MTDARVTLITGASSGIGAATAARYLSEGACVMLADINEESANLLTLQTRSSLGTTALQLSSQADQSVLRLF